MNKKDIIAARSQFVVIGNGLIQKKKYSLNTIEQKLVLYMASKITPYDEPNTVYTFSFKDFRAVCNLNDDSGTYKPMIQEMLLGLKGKPIEIYPDNGTLIITSWFDDAIVNEKDETVKITFSKHLTPYLYNLKTYYTQFCLDNVLPMRSKYAIRLYEYLRSIKSKGYKQTIDIEEVKARIDAEKYKNYKDFRMWCLEPALEEINTYTDISVKCSPIRSGRRVSHLEFQILPMGNNPQRRINREQALEGDVKGGKESNQI